MSLTRTAPEALAALRAVPCAPRHFARSLNSLRSNNARLIAKCLRCSARTQRDLKTPQPSPPQFPAPQVAAMPIQQKTSESEPHTLNPFCCAEHRSRLWIRPAGERQGCRSSFVGPGMARRKTPTNDEEHRAPEGRNNRAAFSFVSFFWPRKRKGHAAFRRKIEK